MRQWQSRDDFKTLMKSIASAMAEGVKGVLAASAPSSPPTGRSARRSTTTAAPARPRAGSNAGMEGSESTDTGAGGGGGGGAGERSEQASRRASSSVRTVRRGSNLSASAGSIVGGAGGGGAASDVYTQASSGGDTERQAGGGSRGSSSIRRPISPLRIPSAPPWQSVFGGGGGGGGSARDTALPYATTPKGGVIVGSAAEVGLRFIAEDLVLSDDEAGHGSGGGGLGDAGRARSGAELMDSASIRSDGVLSFSTIGSMPAYERIPPMCKQLGASHSIEERTAALDALSGFAPGDLLHSEHWPQVRDACVHVCRVACLVRCDCSPLPSAPPFSFTRRVCRAVCADAPMSAAVATGRAPDLSPARATLQSSALHFVWRLFREASAVSPVQTGDLCKGLVTQLLQHHAINRFRAHTVQVYAPASAGSKHPEQLRACIAFDVNEGGTALVFRKYRLLHKMLAELPEHLNHLPVSAANRASLSLLATVLLLLLTHSYVCPPFAG